MEATTLPVLVLFAFLLAGQRCCDGFSVELIHRDSPRSPFHDPALSPHARMLAAARRSLASSGEGGAVSRIVIRSFEYLMSLNVGTPPTRLLAIVDTGSDLVWVNCGNSSIDSSGQVRVAFDPATSSSYGGPVGCRSDACKALGHPAPASCDNSCQFRYTYGEGEGATGLLSTETFSFAGAGNGSDDDAFRAENVTFGCANHSDALVFPTAGIVGLNGGALSLVTQLAAAATNFGGRRFSYCLVPFAATNASSALNFGASAVVSEPGAATTPLVDGEAPDAYYTVELEAVAVGGQAVVNLTSRIIVDSGATVTTLDPALQQPLAAELRRRIALPPAHSPDPQLVDVCYNVTGREAADYRGAIPDVTLRFGGGAEVTLRPDNMFAVVEDGSHGTLCLVVLPVSEDQPVSILGHVAQQNFHVGYDLDERTVTFAPTDCTLPSASS